jgi:hypothetical protein
MEKKRRKMRGVPSFETIDEHGVSFWKVLELGVKPCEALELGVMFWNFSKIDGPESESDFTRMNYLQFQFIIDN